jgi:hypothetical protein
LCLQEKRPVCETGLGHYFTFTLTEVGSMSIILQRGNTKLTINLQTIVILSFLAIATTMVPMS